MDSKHPYEPFIPEGATKLIIGTIPPPRFCTKEGNKHELNENDVDFYYGSKDNSFWYLLSEVFNESFEYKRTAEAIKQRKEFLAKHKIGITDIVSTCIHSNGSAEDRSLRDIVHKNLRKLLCDHPSVRTLLYTSAFVKRQINDHLKDIKLTPYHSKDENNREVQHIKIDGKIYEAKILFSHSPNALRGLRKEGEQKRLEQYRRFFTA